MNARRLSEWQIVFWSVFLACFVGAGALSLKSVSHLRMVSDQGRYNSIDAALRAELGMENGVATLEAAVADLPKETPISVVYCIRGFRAMPGIITSQILWSRPIEEVRCTSPYGNDLETGPLKARGGVAIFVGVPSPKELGEPTEIGSRVQLVKITAPR